MRKPIYTAVFLNFLLVSAAVCQEGASKVFEVRAASKQIVFTGFTRARAEITLVSEVAGRCEAVEADMGDALAEDGIFAQLDNTFVLLDLEKNRNEQARLENRLAYLSRETERYKNLVEKQTISQSSFEETANRLDQARLELAGLKTAEKILEERLARFRLKGSPGWRVIERLVEPGQWVNTGGAVARLGDYRSLYVPFALDAQTTAQLRDMQHNLEVNLPDLGLRVPASVRRVSPDFDPETRKIAVDLEIRGGLPEMRGGLRVTLEMESQSGSGEVLAPKEAMEKRYDDWWVTREDGTTFRVRVLGEGPGDLMRVEAGKLKAGDRIVVKDRP